MRYPAAASLSALACALASSMLAGCSCDASATTWNGTLVYSISTASGDGGAPTSGAAATSMTLDPFQPWSTNSFVGEQCQPPNFTIDIGGSCRLAGLMTTNDYAYHGADTASATVAGSGSTCFIPVQTGVIQLDVQSGTIDVSGRTMHMVLAGPQGSVQFDGSTSG